MCPAPDTVRVILFLLPLAEIPTEHAIQKLVRLVRVIVRQAIVICHIVRKDIHPAEPLIEERFENGGLIQVVPESEQRCIPLSLELGQAAMAIKIDREEVVDVVDQTVFRVLSVPVIDHTKDHTTTKDTTTRSLGS
jgi:hypothetical protein